MTIYSGTPGLPELKTTGNVVNLAVLDEMRSSLLKKEWHTGHLALAADVEHPVEVAGPRFAARLASHRDLLAPVAQPVTEIDSLE